MNRCCWAIEYRPGLRTRCAKPEHARGDSHMGHGVPGELPGRIWWTWFDQRSYRTERTDEHAWKGTR